MCSVIEVDQRDNPGDRGAPLASTSGPRLDSWHGTRTASLANGGEDAGSVRADHARPPPQTSVAEHLASPRLDREQREFEQLGGVPHALVDGHDLGFPNHCDRGQMNCIQRTNWDGRHASVACAQHSSVLLFKSCVQIQCPDLTSGNILQQSAIESCCGAWLQSSFALLAPEGRPCLEKSDAGSNNWTRTADSEVLKERRVRLFSVQFCQGRSVPVAHEPRSERRSSRISSVVGSVLPVAVSSRSRANSASHPLRSEEVPGTAVSRATAWPRLVRTTSSPRCANSMRRGHSDCNCSTVAIINLIKHPGAMCQMLLYYSSTGTTRFSMM